MANVKITDLGAYTDPASTDVLPIVDVGADVTKKVSIANLLENAGSGTAAAPGIAFDDDSDTGIYRPGVDRVAISTGGTGRLFVDSTGYVGVGLSNPNVLLHLDLGVIGFGDIANRRVAEIEGLRESSSYAGSLIFRTQVASGSTFPGVERLRLTSTGTLKFVGAGTAGSTEAVSFNGSAPVDSLVIDSSGRLLVGTSSESGGSLLQVNDDRIRIASSKTPASASDTGTAGEICWDSSYIYVCTATNTWKRAALSTW